MSNHCIISPPFHVPALRSILEKLSLNDPDRRLKYYKDEGLVAIPVKCSISANDLKAALGQNININDLQIKTADLPRAKRLTVKTPQVLLRERLKQLVIESGNQWTDEMSKDIPGHWELHGDLVLISDKSFTLSVWKDIGNNVWKTMIDVLSCKRVARKYKVSIDGYRTPQVDLLYGDNGWVEHIDNGIRYNYDVTKCMFSVGNITEKLRIAKFNCSGEVVVDLYAGIGYFTLPYLVHTGVKHLHACEWNQDAVQALKRNLVLNGVQNRCTIYAGDNRQMCPRGIADRVNLGLIPSSREGWPVACAALKPDTGGVLHIHYNVNTKPKARNQDNVNQCSSEPADIFRCEAKCWNNADCINSVSQECDRKVSGTKLENCSKMGCERLRTKECEDTNNSAIFEADTCAKSRIFNRPQAGNTCFNGGNQTSCHGCKIGNNGNASGCHGICDFECMSETCVNKQTLNEGKNVDHSKWYSWAKTTSNEIQDILHEIHKSEWITRILHIEHVKSYAPYVDHIVLDLACKPKLCFM